MTSSRLSGVRREAWGVVRVFLSKEKRINMLQRGKCSGGNPISLFQRALANEHVKVWRYKDVTSRVEANTEKTPYYHFYYEATQVIL